MEAALGTPRLLATTCLLSPSLGCELSRGRAVTGLWGGSHPDSASALIRQLLFFLI